jgi:DNA processing protein
VPLECTEGEAHVALRELLPDDADERTMERCLRWILQPGHHFITRADPRFPRLLREIADPPAALFALGRLELLQAECFAIVGSRNATPSGKRDAARFASHLSARGLCIVSGLALGIDAAAHRGALSQAGSSIAVLGTGADVVYPKENAGLAAQLADEGCIVTEFPVGTAPRGWNFPKRNRLISGLSRGVLVVEAALKSGSLVTAYEALRQDREVFAIPGSIHATLAKGCHALIRDGAKLVESADHILEEFPRWRAAGGEEPPPGPARRTRDPFLEAMGFAPLSVDAIVGLTGLAAADSTARLAMLEIEGRVTRLAGGLYQRMP